MSLSDGNNFPEWKQFLSIGEELLNQPHVDYQCKIVSEKIQAKMGGNNHIWLAQPFFPLPGEPEIITLPDPGVPSIVSEAYLSHSPIQKVHPETGCAELAMPILTQQNLLGIVHIERCSLSEFTQEEIQYLDGLLSYVASAFQITRQVILKNWRYDQLALVRKVSFQIANITDLDELCRQITLLIRKTFHFYYVAIFTLNEDECALQYRASSQINPNDENASLNLSLCIGEGMVGYVAQTGQELHAPDVNNEPHYRHLDALPETRSEIAIPLKIEDRILGVLDLQSNELDAFHEHDLLVIHALADTIAMAIEGTRLYSDLEWQTQQMQALIEVSNALTSILDLDELLNTIVEVVHKRFGFPYVHLFSVHSGRRLIFYKAGSGARSRAFGESEVTYDLDSPLGLIPWAARNNQTILANDVAIEPLYVPSALPPQNTQSELSIPVSFGNEVLAVLDIQSDQRNSFDERDRSILESLARTIAITFRNATLYRSEQWRRQVAESFRDVANLMAANISLDHLLDHILEAMDQNLPCEVSALWLFEEGAIIQGQPEKFLRLAAVRGISADELNKVVQGSKDVLDVLIDTARSLEPTIRKPSDGIGPLGTVMNFPADYSSIDAPLVSGDQILGVLSLAHHTPNRYGSEAHSMTNTFASYAAVAIQNNRLFASSQEQAWISTVMLQVSEATQAVTSIDELMSTMARLTPLLIGVKKCAFLLWNESLNTFQIEAAYGVDFSAERVFSHPLPSALQTLQTEHNLLFIQDPVEELRLPELLSTQEEQTTLVLMPLLARGQLLGAVLVAHQSTHRTGVQLVFDQQTQSILQGIAHQTAVALENIRLLEARQEEAYVTAVLLQVAQAVVSQNNLQDILDTIVHLMPILVGIDTCIIYLWNKEVHRFTLAQAYTGSHAEEITLLGKEYTAGDFPFIDTVREEETSMIAPLFGMEISPADWKDLVVFAGENSPIFSSPINGSWLLAVPLLVKGEVFGVLVIKENHIPPSLHSRRMEIITGVAHQVALAVQNELLNVEMVERERLEKEISLARQIQQTFLPSSLPQSSGWNIDARWQTARQVGGDFYDVIKLGKNRLGLVIADVSDKGMPAALYMTVTRTLFRAFVQNTDSPGKVLEKINKLLVVDSPNGMFVTCCYAILSLDTGKLVIANAGHNRPLIKRCNQNSVEILPRGGMAMGVLSNSQYGDASFDLDPDDFILLYTDGVTESFSPSGEAFGEQRLNNLIKEMAEKTASAILDSIKTKLLDFREGAPPSDDLTMVVVHRTVVEE